MKIAKVKDQDPVAPRIYPVRATPTIPGIAAPVLLLSSNTRDVERDTEKMLANRILGHGQRTLPRQW